jgi:hypothetical protein
LNWTARRYSGTRSMAAGMSWVARRAVRPTPRPGNLNRLNAYAEVAAIRRPTSDVPVVMTRLLNSHSGRSVSVSTSTNALNVAPSGMSWNSLSRIRLPGRSATLSTRTIGNAAMTQARIRTA